MAGGTCLPLAMTFKSNHTMRKYLLTIATLLSATILQAQMTTNGGVPYLLSQSLDKN